MTRLQHFFRRPCPCQSLVLLPLMRRSRLRLAVFLQKRQERPLDARAATNLCDGAQPYRFAVRFCDTVFLGREVQRGQGYGVFMLKRLRGCTTVHCRSVADVYPPSWALIRSVWWSA